MLTRPRSEGCQLSISTSHPDRARAYLAACILLCAQQMAALLPLSVQGRLSQWVETQRAERAAMAARMIKLQAEHMGRSNHVDSFRAKMKWTEVHPPTP